MPIDYNAFFAEDATDKYNWTNADYLKGLEVIQQNPPIRQIFDNLFNRLDKKAKDLNDRLIAVEGLNATQIIDRETHYDKGFICRYEGMPEYIVVECVESGITASSLPDLSGLTYSETLEEITDGTAVFRTKYYKMNKTFGCIELWGGAVNEDNGTGFVNPVVILDGSHGLILKDWRVCNGKAGLPDTIDKTVRGTDGTQMMMEGGVDELQLTRSNLPAVSLTFNGVTDDTTHGEEGAQLILETSAETINMAVKTATGDATLSHASDSGVAGVPVGATLADNTNIVGQVAHKHTINTVIQSPPHTHTFKGHSILGSGQKLQIKNAYVNLCYIMCME